MSQVILNISPKQMKIEKGVMVYPTLFQNIFLFLPTTVRVSSMQDPLLSTSFEVSNNDIDLYEQAKAAIDQDPNLSKQKRKNANKALTFIRVLLCIFVVVFLIYTTATEWTGPQPLRNTTLEKSFQTNLTHTYCDISFGWLKCPNGASKCTNPCSIKDQTTCDTNNYIYEETINSCYQCKNTNFGTQCQFICPGVQQGQPCNGNGKCDNGLFGTGQCFCNLPYRGSPGRDCRTSYQFIALFICILSLPGIALVPPSFHRRLFVCFFRCQNCPTILVENELALSQLPSSVSQLVYSSIYGGILTLVLIPLLSLGHSICTVKSDLPASTKQAVSDYSGRNWLAFGAGK